MNSNDYIVEMLEAIEEAIDSPASMSLPDPAVLSLYQNLKERRIWLDLSVTESTLEYARFIVRWNEEDAGKPAEERKPIWLYLLNYGGVADYMWMLTDIIALSETPVYTVNVGRCCSAAALIFMSGHKRFMLPQATVMLHEGSNEISGDAVKVIDQAESYKLMVRKMHRFILSHTSIPAATLTRKKNNDWELDAEECIKYGVCDQVVTSLQEIL